MRLWSIAVVTCVPLVVFGESGGPPVPSSGVPADGGQNCTACHRTFAPANSDTRGRITVETGSYRPGVKQIIKVMVEHPEAMRWGFQLTARLASEESRKAGTFTQNTSIRVRCSGGAPEGNCGDNTEFASHRRPSTQPATPERGSWEVEWTPPASDGGEVVFYAAGNAANNNNLNTGDRIYTTSVRIRAEAACELRERPRVSAVRHGASFAEGPFALNTLISLGGTGFQAAGATRAVQSSDIAEGKLPAELGCIAVEIAGRRAPVTYVSENQINVQIPTTTALGAVEARVIANPGRANEQRGDAFPLQLAERAPGLFRFLPSTAVAAVFASGGELAGDPSAVAGARAPRAGDLVSLFATGLGVTDPVYQAGEITVGLARVQETVQVEFNGATMRAEDVLFAGLSPVSVSGLYQINIRVPANARPNANNSVRVRVGGVLSPEGTTLFVAQ